MFKYELKKYKIIKLQIDTAKKNQISPTVFSIVQIANELIKLVIERLNEFRRYPTPYVISCEFSIDNVASLAVKVENYKRISRTCKGKS